jgi:hypothetical protein
LPLHRWTNDVTLYLSHAKNVSSSVCFQWTALMYECAHVNIRILSVISTCTSTHTFKISSVSCHVFGNWSIDLWTAFLFNCRKENRLHASLSTPDAFLLWLMINLSEMITFHFRMTFNHRIYPGQFVYIRTYLDTISMHLFSHFTFIIDSKQRRDIRLTFFSAYYHI